MSETIYYGSDNLVDIGNVGIGTVSPSTILHVYGDRPVLALQTSSTAAGRDPAFILYNSAGSSKASLGYSISGDYTYYLSDTINRQIIIYDTTSTNGTGIHMIGNVGIGTATPVSPFTVQGSSNLATFADLSQTYPNSKKFSILYKDPVGDSGFYYSTFLGKSLSIEGTTFTFHSDGPLGNRFMSAIELGNAGINFYSNLQPNVTTDQAGITMAQLQNSRLMRLFADFSTSTLPILTLSSGSREFPVSLLISETTHGTSKRACIQLGESWQLLQDMTGNGTRNFGIYGNGNMRLAILPDGNVGIGTVNPVSPLQINCGDGYIKGISFSSAATNASPATDFMIQRGPSVNGTGGTNWNSSNCMIFHTPNETVATSSPVGYLWMSSGSRPGMFYNVNNSRLGIGTTNPIAPLHVYGDVPNINLSRAVPGVSLLYQDNGMLGFNYGGGFGAGTRDSFRISAVPVNRDGGGGPYFDYGAQADLVFERKFNNLFSGGGADQIYTEVMRIRGSANCVGIGTNYPEAPLAIMNSSTTGDPRYSMLDCYNPANTANQNSIISNRIGGNLAGNVFYSMDVAGSYGFSMGMQANSSRLSFRNSWAFVESEVMSLFLNGYSIGLPKYKGNGSTVNGVGMYTSAGFDAAGTTHTISLIPNSPFGDNYAGRLYVVGKNTNAGSGKVGIILVTVIKRAGFNFGVGTPTYASGGMTTWAILTGSQASIVVNTDSDVRIAWQFFVGI